MSLDIHNSFAYGSLLVVEKIHVKSSLSATVYVSAIAVFAFGRSFSILARYCTH